MATESDIGSAHANAGGNRLARGAMPSFPHPTDSGRSVQWNRDSFDVNGRPQRVLTYTVAPSGWTDALTQLHEDTGGSDHFIDVASREYALNEVARVTV